MVKIIDMTNIRRKILQNPPQLLRRFPGIDTGQSPESASSMVVNIGRICANPVSKTPVRMVHTEVLHLMPSAFQAGTKAEYICLRSALWVEKFVDQQYFHWYSSNVRCATRSQSYFPQTYSAAVLRYCSTSCGVSQMACSFSFRSCTFPF